MFQDEEWLNPQNHINQAYDNFESVGLEDLKAAIFATLEALDKGTLTVVQKTNSDWVVHEWIKKAILLYFRLMPLKVMQAGDLKFFDKIPLKEISPQNQFRVVPHAVVRYGSFIGKGVVLMPSYVNIGAYVDEGSMIDTWATVGSCARIGKGVHLSGGVGIGGVLEPPQAKPVIIGDHAFIGSRAIIVEGASIGDGAVVAANTVITASTRILDVRQSQAKILRGTVPDFAVVIPGTSEKEINGHKIQIPCAYIIGTRNESTDQKVSLNNALRDFDVSV